MKHLVIIGAGELGREMYWHATMSKGYGTEFDIKGYLDGDFRPEAEKYKNLQEPLMGTEVTYTPDEDDVFICAFGNSNSRENVHNEMKRKGGQFINLINKTAIIQGNVNIGEGVLIGPYTVIGDNVTIGNHVMLNTHSSIGHDAVIGDYTCIMSYVDVTGCCQIGKKVFLASGCRMTPSTKIGDGAYVGIGSVVLRKVKPGVKVFGNPARVVDI